MEVSRLATLGDKDNDELKVLSNPNSFDNVRICSCKNVGTFYAGASIRVSLTDHGRKFHLLETTYLTTIISFLHVKNFAQIIHSRRG